MRLVTDNDTETDNTVVTSDAQELFDRIINSRNTTTSSNYPVAKLNLPLGEIHTQADILNGGKRTRKYGAVVGLDIIPNYPMMMQKQVPLPDPQLQLVDSDSTEELRERLHQMVDLSVDIAEMSINNPDAFQQFNQLLQDYFQDMEGSQGMS